MAFRSVLDLRDGVDLLGRAGFGERNVGTGKFRA